MSIVSAFITFLKTIFDQILSVISFGYYTRPPNGKQAILEVARSIKNYNIYKSKIIECLDNIDLVGTQILPCYADLSRLMYLSRAEFNPTARKFYKKRSMMVKPRFSKSELEAILRSENETSISAGTSHMLYLGEDPTITQEFKKLLFSLDEFNAAFTDIVGNKRDFFKVSKFMISNFPNHIKIHLNNLFNQMVYGDRQINIAQHAVGVGYLIYKEAKMGPIDDIKSYRNIITIPHIINHLHRIIALRMTNYFLRNKLIDTNINKGCIPGIKYSILEQILKVKYCMEHAVMSRNNIHVVFIDITNAFPSINRESLIKLLLHYKVDPRLVEYIKTYYENFEYCMAVPGRAAGTALTGLQKWNQGIIQGCPMSPILFNIIINHILVDLNKKYAEGYGYDAEGVPLLFTGYLDDICIISRKANGLRMIYDVLEAQLSAFGLKINKSKTKYMTTTKSTNFNGIEKVSQFTYLGETLVLAEDGSNPIIYKQIFKELFKKMYRLDRGYRSDNRSKVEHFNSVVKHWFRKKMVVHFDLTLREKTNLLRIIQYYLKKWGGGAGRDSTLPPPSPLPPSVGPMFIGLKSFLESDDPYVKNILKTDYVKKYDKMSKSLNNKETPKHAPKMTFGYGTV